MAPLSLLLSNMAPVGLNKGVGFRAYRLALLHNLQLTAQLLGGSLPHSAQPRPQAQRLRVANLGPPMERLE